jgi:hypothetical protein
MFYAGCFIISKKEDPKVFEIKIEQLDMWYDAMPKLDSKSMFHINLVLELKNVSSKSVKIDSIIYEFVLSDDQILSFKDGNYSSKFLLKSGEIKNLKSLEHLELKRQIPQNDRQANFSVTIFFRMDSKTYLQKFFLKSQEFEIVY